MDIVYRTRWHSDPEMFAEITPTPTNKLSVGNVEKVPAREEGKK